jgi:hypothetical protein
VPFTLKRAFSGGGRSVAFGLKGLEHMGDQEHQGKQLWKYPLIFAVWLFWVVVSFGVLYAFRVPVLLAVLAALPLGYFLVHAKYMFELLGAVLGCLMGFFAPMIYAYIYVARGGDPTAAGALWIFCFITIPAGIVIGAVIGFAIRRYFRYGKE